MMMIAQELIDALQRGIKSAPQSQRGKRKQMADGREQRNREKHVESKKHRNKRTEQRKAELLLFARCFFASFFAPAKKEEVMLTTDCFT
jgi:hypothetical protein